MITFQKKIINEEILTLAEVKEILAKRAEGNIENLSYLQKMTYSYVNEFCKLSVEEALEFRNEIVNRFGLSINTATQIANLKYLPTLVDELEIFLRKEPKKLTDEEKKELLELILTYKVKIEGEEPEIEEKKEETQQLNEIESEASQIEDVESEA
ncbi:MAG: hypothetical protein ACTSPQ_21160 [Candidatus Helarchaeota archaeon]